MLRKGFATHKQRKRANCCKTLFTELNADQARETVNSNQRYCALREASRKLGGYRGSLVWHTVGDDQYLNRSYYDASGKRRQKVEGRRSAESERLRADWERGREIARERLAAAMEVMSRQRAINRVLGLGRLPAIAARIIRAVDKVGLLGSGLRIAGTNALYCYEAAAGVHVEAATVVTQDVDLLMDARRSLKIIVSDEVTYRGLLDILKGVDRTFERMQQTFRAANKDGYLVDLIRPVRNPPWKDERTAIGPATDDLRSVQIEGPEWLESSPSFEAVAIDERGLPMRMVASDPRVFAAHKLWLSEQPSREPVKRRRDRLQATAVASILSTHLTHLGTGADDLRMLPKELRSGLHPLLEQSRSRISDQASNTSEL